MAPQRNGVLTMLAVALGIIGTVGGSVWTMEVRYAKSTELAQHVQDHRQQVKGFNADILESRRQAIRGRIFEMEQTGKTRRLTPEEQRYLDELRLQYQEVSDKVKDLSR